MQDVCLTLQRTHAYLQHFSETLTAAGPYRLGYQALSQQNNTLIGAKVVIDRILRLHRKDIYYSNAYSFFGCFSFSHSIKSQCSLIPLTVVWSSILSPSSICCSMTFVSVATSCFASDSSSVAPFWSSL